MKLNKKDYIHILQFYKIHTAGMDKKSIQEKAEHLLATKLCKCIKNIQRYNVPPKATTTAANGEKKAIAICYNSVIRNKNLKTFKFKCKDGPRFLPKKGTRKLVIIKTK